MNIIDYDNFGTKLRIESFRAQYNEKIANESFPAKKSTQYHMQKKTKSHKWKL